jgi:hypothetical protein
MSLSKNLDVLARREEARVYSNVSLVSCLLLQQSGDWGAWHSHQTYEKKKERDKSAR